MCIEIERVKNVKFLIKKVSFLVDLIMLFVCISLCFFLLLTKPHKKVVNSRLVWFYKKHDLEEVRELL